MKKVLIFIAYLLAEEFERQTFEIFDCISTKMMMIEPLSPPFSSAALQEVGLY